MIGRMARAKVVQRASVEIENRFAVLSGGEKVREETVKKNVKQAKRTHVQYYNQNSKLGKLCSTFSHLDGIFNIKCTQLVLHGT